MSKAIVEVYQCDAPFLGSFSLPEEEDDPAVYLEFPIQVLGNEMNVTVPIAFVTSEELRVFIKQLEVVKSRMMKLESSRYRVLRRR